MTAALSLLRNIFPASAPVLPGDVVRTTTPITDFNGNVLINVVMQSGTMQDMRVEVIDFSAASYTPASDKSGAVFCSRLNADVDFNIPLGLPKGWNCLVTQFGTDTLNFVMDPGVTIVNRNGHSRLAGQYASASIVITNDAGSEAVLTGDTKP